MYLAPQNIPSKTVLIPGHKVVLYCIGNFSSHFMGKFSPHRMSNFSYFSPHLMQKFHSPSCRKISVHVLLVSSVHILRAASAHSAYCFQRGRPSSLVSKHSAALRSRFSAHSILAVGRRHDDNGVVVACSCQWPGPVQFQPFFPGDGGKHSPPTLTEEVMKCGRCESATGFLRVSDLWSSHFRQALAAAVDLRQLCTRLARRW